MNIQTTDLHPLHDQAHRQAELLRREALADFWRGADALMASMSDTAYRSAARLAYRLARRAHPQHQGDGSAGLACPGQAPTGCR